MIMERCTQEVIGSWEDVKAIENEFDALEAKMGNVPTKRRYWSTYAGLPFATMVWERDWESLADLETYNNKTMNDPEWSPMFDKAGKVFGTSHRELYWSW